MPGMSGLNLLPKVKAARPNVPVIMITEYGDTETRRTVLEAGAEALFTKPIISPRSGTTSRLALETSASSAATRMLGDETANRDVSYCDPQRTSANHFNVRHSPALVEDRLLWAIHSEPRKP